MFYPRSSIEMDGGDLITIVNLSLNIKNGAAAETTMRSSGSGFSFGSVTADGSFDLKNPTTSERDFMGMVIRKEIKEITFKHPDGTRVPLSIAPSDAGFKDQETGASTTAWSFVGFVRA